MKKRFLAVFLGIFLLLSGCMGTPSDPGGSSDPSSGGSVPFDFEILDKSQPHRILVLGNSFIWTSDVDGQLLELASANGVRLEVTRHAVGYSQAAGHYQDIFVQQLYPEVFENYYDVILLQTIYQFNDYLAVGDFLTAMDRYGIEAQLLLFPAENEGGYAENAKADYPKARLANWKQLLFEVKYNLGFGNALNFDDDIQHSSPLAGFAGEEFVGYVGRHREGSVGLLNVFPQYRRRGYGQELETFILNQVVAAGERPYCQIFEGNAASLALQAKLGWLLAEKPICWLFPPEG